MKSMLVPFILTCYCYVGYGEIKNAYKVSDGWMYLVTVCTFLLLFILEQRTLATDVS
jgi:hypothetical protein